MKSLKQITAELLVLCLMIGMPLVVSAVGTETPAEFKLLYAMEMPDWMAKHNDDKGRTILLYFNSTPMDPGDNVYFELLGYTTGNTNMANSNNSRTMAVNPRYGKWGTSNMIALTIDKNLNGNYTEESNFSTLFANTNVDTSLWHIGISQPGATNNDNLINNWTNTGNKTMTATGRRTPYIVGGPTLTEGDALFVPIVKQKDLLTLKSANLGADNKVTFSFSEPVYMDTSRYAKAAALRVVDSEYNLVKYDPSNIEAPYSTTSTSGTDLTIILSITNTASGQLSGSFSDPSNGTISGLTLQEHLAKANAQDGEGTYRLCATIAEGGVKPERGEYINSRFVDTVWSYDPATDTHSYKPLVATQYDGSRDRTWCEVTIASFEASIGEQTYATLSQAIEEATTGQTVTLRDNVTVDSLTDNTGITLDLAGHVLTVKNTVKAIAPNSNIIDSIEGQGGIKINKNVKKTDTEEGKTYLEIQANNAMLPLYDAEFTGYKFFTVSMEHLAKTDECKFGFRMAMNATAYGLLTDAANADMKLITNLMVTVDGIQVLEKDYVFNKVADYATRMLTNPSPSLAITLTVTGFDSLSGENIQVTSTPRIKSSTGVLLLPTTDTTALTYNHAQGE